ncbi:MULTISPECIES: GNAT family N-acetyltransferase [Acinetobacter]|uniref:hypothetical protein n=1 Tax=Acinetobacter TaxID=469 RepID=UPI000263DF6D|nr:MULTISPECIES: hypothetical protein [Acinetobacter]AWD70279.1 N-acetyltransferase [Acinetobacter schindleri]EIM40548.1 hypothetical protein HADU_01084 [Acinetobacter sp. HA]MDP1443473.1 N-acetyltransferase [Acinetobacter schindleri]
MLIKQKFSEINLENSFFDSLKSDYKEFAEWFKKKADANDEAYVFYTDNQTIDGFLYLKIEHDALTDLIPNMPAKLRLKLGTLKINAHGTKLGERFIKKVFDHLIFNNLDEVYVTVFDHHIGLIKLLEKYGFVQEAIKQTLNGVERVYFKKLDKSAPYDIYTSYPLLNTMGNRKYVLAIYPEFHSRLLPDSVLTTEDPQNVIRDVSHTNSIHKIYLCKMDAICTAKKGDILCIYRTTPVPGRAKYLAVMTSICTIEEYRHIASFESLESFLSYALPFSIFSEIELKQFYRDKKYPYIIRFSYNIALPKRIIRNDLINEVGLNENAYWGCFELSDVQFKSICQLGRVNENIIINKTTVC